MVVDQSNGYPPKRVNMLLFLCVAIQFILTSCDVQDKDIEYEYRKAYVYGSRISYDYKQSSGKSVAYIQYTYRGKVFKNSVKTRKSYRGKFFFEGDTINVRIPKGNPYEPTFMEMIYVNESAVKKRIWLLRE